MSKPTDPGQRLHALMDALAEKTSTLSDQDIIDDALAEGLEVKAEAADVRNLLLLGIQRVKRLRLEESRAAYVRAVASINAAAIQLPKEPAAQRELLSRVIRHRPEMREAVVTLQHRNFDSLSDDDVESALRQLHYLGVLSEADSGAEK